jgi:hypothetical protein
MCDKVLSFSLNDKKTNQKYCFYQFSGLDKQTKTWHNEDFTIVNDDTQEFLQSKSILVNFNHDGTVSLLMEDIHDPSKKFHLTISNSTYKDMQDRFLKLFQYDEKKHTYTKDRLDFVDINALGWDYLISSSHIPADTNQLPEHTLNPYIIETLTN